MELYDLRDLITRAIHAARVAATDILQVYGTEFTVDTKEDKSPLTEADRRSTAAIESVLAQTKLPVLGEEGRQIPYEERRAWQWYWLVDPLDGTKEFVKRNGEFTVNIALISATRPVGGVVYVPVTGELYFAAEGSGAWQGKVKPVKADATPCSWDALTSISQRLPAAASRSHHVAVASRSHLTPETEAYIAALRERHGTVEVASRGSSLKLCMVAANAADVYPRFGPTMEWDTAAGQAVVEESGATVLLADHSGAPLAYNKPDLLTPWFVASRHAEKKPAP